VLARKIDFAWRLAATGFAFILFSAGGLVLTIISFPIGMFVGRNVQRQTAFHQKLIQLAFRVFLGFLRLSRVLELRFFNTKRLQSEQGTLVVANHPTLLDIVILVSILPKAQCVVKRGLLDNRFFGKIVRAAGYIPNYEDPEVLVQRCVASLRDGNNLIIFPEGTRSDPGQPIQFKRGFAHIATLAKSRIQLVTITCSPITLTSKSRWYEIPVSRAQFDISVDKLVDSRDYLVGVERSIVVRRLTRDLERYFTGKLDHA